MHLCATNLVLSDGAKRPWSSCAPASQTLRHSPEAEAGLQERDWRQFTGPSSQAPRQLAPHQALLSLLHQPQLLRLPRALQPRRPQPSAPGGDAGAWRPGGRQRAEATKLTCTFHPGLLPFASQWYLNKVCSSVCPYLPVLQPPHSTCNSLLPPLIYLSSSLSPRPPPLLLGTPAPINSALSLPRNKN